MNKVNNLETEHKRILQSFQKQSTEKTKLNAERVRVQLQLKNAKSEKRKQELTTKLNKIEEKLNNNTVDRDKRDYFLKTSRYLYDYYVDPTMVEKKESSNKLKKLGGMVEQVGSSNKSTTFDKYMSSLYPEYELNIDDMYNDDMKCECGKDLVQKSSGGELVCTECGTSYEDIIDSDKKVYKNVPPDAVYLSYKRSNHVNELLAQFQGKENTNIPMKDYDTIKKECKKKRVDVDKLTPKMMRAILKKLKLTSYYEHIPHIIHKINGKPILTLSREMEKRIRGMFSDLQEPFLECKPADRQNFTNYSYIFYKIFELLELDEFLHCFTLFKGDSHLYEADKVWRCMCAKLRWEFIPTIRT